MKKYNRVPSNYTGHMHSFFNVLRGYFVDNNPRMITLFKKEFPKVPENRVEHYLNFYNEISDKRPRPLYRDWHLYKNHEEEGEE